ncbi:MAG TPA: universal stress protein [Gemmataceae bacterium]|nr:universal stress protein [Gemmataceae bacterium]
MSVFHTILHPTDFDPPSLEAFRVARSLAQQLGAKVIAFHIAPSPTAITGDGRVITDPKSPTPVDLWTDYRTAAAQTPDVEVRYSLVVGKENEATKMMIELIGQNPAGVLIVMGTHARTGLSRLIWGNRAEEVVRLAPCSVLVVKEGAQGG